MAVVLFHFNPSWLAGGFVGVDIFFVISGFLMTKIICEGLDKGTFSLIKFYVARINRIIPSLSLLCLVLLFLGWFFLVPSDYRQLGKYVKSSLTFLSNMSYAHETGYFATSVYDKWLLHTWSLSVEWQFYMLYPLFLMLMKKYISFKTLKWVIFHTAILGFIYSLIAVHYWPQSAYFSLQTRVWEMLVGALAFLFPFEIKKKKCVVFFALCLVITSCIFVSKNALWPGWLASFPVFGAFLLIIANSRHNALLNNQLVQKMGQCSYSIYLWHWPIVVGLHYLSLSGEWIVIGIFVSLILGWLNQRYVESIKWTREINSPRELLKCKPLQFMIFVLLVGLIIFWCKGFPNKNAELVIGEKATKPQHFEYCFEGIEEKKGLPCVFHSAQDYDRSEAKNVKALVLGDSHASSVVLSVLKSLKESGSNGDVVFFGYAGCLPVSREINLIDSKKKTAACNEYSRRVLDFVRQYPQAKVIISNRLAAYFWGMNEFSESNPLKMVSFMSENRALDQNALLLKNAYLEFIHHINVIAETYIVLPIPEHQVDISKEMAKHVILGKALFQGISKAEYQNRNKFVLQMLHEIEGVSLLDPSQILCNETVCRASSSDQPLYYDDDHLNILGAELISPIFDSLWQ